MIKPLPLGRSGFPALRENEAIYVDKTRLICKIAQQSGKFFLARPRRFGKSLLISTFESLFKDGLTNFHGLEAESIWNDRRYPVAHLDFSGLKEFRSYEDFRVRLQGCIYRGFYPCGFDCMPDGGFRFIIELGKWLKEQGSSSIVLLIDEYDSPLTAHLDDPGVFGSIRSLMGEFYAMIKEMDNCFRFVFITGITKFQGAAIFSELNNLVDLTLREEYGDLLGYTDPEILKYFPEYLERAGNALGLSRSRLMDELREQYDGYCFEMTCTKHVYSPWSVLSFLDNPKIGFMPYWYDTAGQPTVLLKYLGGHALERPEAYEAEKAVPYSALTASQDYDRMNDAVLLLQTGYLTLKKLERHVFTLGYPNKEVADAMARLYADLLLKNPDSSKLKLARLSSVLANGSLEDVAALFNIAFESINYDRYPVVNENACRAYLHVLLLGAALVTRAELSNAHGRSDLEVDAGNRHWIFELKYAEKPSLANVKLAEAVEQMQKRRYGAEHLTTQTLIRAALVFDGSARRFTQFALVP